MEMVSVSDGTDGNRVTVRLAGDYIHLDGQVSMEDGYIQKLVTRHAFIENLSVGRVQIKDVIESDNFEVGSQGIRLNFVTGEAELGQLEVRGNMVVGNTITVGHLNENAKLCQFHSVGAGTRQIAVTIPANTVATTAQFLIQGTAPQVVRSDAGAGRAGLVLKRNGIVVREAYYEKPDATPDITTARWSGTLVYAEVAICGPDSENITFTLEADGTPSGDLDIISSRTLR